MYPELLRIGSFEVTSFGLMVAAGALVGLWLFERELKRSGLPAEAVNGAVIGVIAGLIGAKLLWAVEHRGEEPIVALLTSRGGLSWFGGLLAEPRGPGLVGRSLRGACRRPRLLPLEMLERAADPRGGNTGDGDRPPAR